MQNLVEGMARLRDRLVGMASSFDLFENKPLFLVVRSEIGESIEQILPNPNVKNTSPQLAAYLERVQNLRIESDTYQVTGISKLYKEEDLLRRGAYYVIGGAVVNGNLVGGVVCDRYPGVDLIETPTSWSLILRGRQK